MTERKKPGASVAAASHQAAGLSRREALVGSAAVAWASLTIIDKAKAAAPLRILAWPGYDEKPVVGEFEEANKVKVEFKNYIGGEQMLQYFAQAPKGTFDAIISDAEYIQKFVAQGALDADEPGGFQEPRRISIRSISDFPLLRAPERQDLGHRDAILAATASRTTRNSFPTRRSTAGQSLLAAEVQGQDGDVRLVLCRT